MSTMIIAVAGRKKSGKSTAAQILEERGFRRVSMADPLKEYVARLYGWDLGDLYTQTGKDSPLSSPVEWDQRAAERLSDIVGQEVLFTSEQVIGTRREALQFIGTDVLRHQWPDFHVCRAVERAMAFEKVYFDDVRFPNEKAALDAADATSVFIVRPYEFDYDNHSSEQSLTRDQFQHVLLNDRHIGLLRRRMSRFLLGDRSAGRKGVDERRLREAYTSCSGRIRKMAETLGCSSDSVAWGMDRLLLPPNRCAYDYDHNAFLHPNEDNSYFAGLLSADGCVKRSGASDNAYVVELGNNDYELVEGFKSLLKSNKPVSEKRYLDDRRHYTFTCHSPMVLDDMKQWGLLPRKSCKNLVPEVIKYRPDLLDQWVVGLIDGDGSITSYATKRGSSLTVSVLASREVSVWLATNYVGARVDEDVKGVVGLFNTRWHGPHAANLVRRVYKGRGLSRKWTPALALLNSSCPAT